MVESRPVPEKLKVKIKGVRKTDNLITPYINFIHQNIHKLLGRTTAAIIKEGAMIDYHWVGPNHIAATLEHRKTGEKYILTIDPGDYSIQKVTKNDLTDKLRNRFEWETIYDDGNKLEFHGYLQGELLEFDFRKSEGNYYLNKVRQKRKAVLLSKDESIRHEFVSEQLYITTEVSSDCRSNGMKTLKKGKALKEIEMTHDEQNWHLQNTLLPLKEQQIILDDLGRVH